MVTDGTGIPLHLVAPAANAHDSPLLEPTLAGVPDAVGPLPDSACVHLDAGYDSGKTRGLLHNLGYHHRIATQGKPSPFRVGNRWVVERTHSWMNGYGNLRRSTEKQRRIVEFFLLLAAAITVIRRLINTAPAPTTAGTPGPPRDVFHDTYCRSLQGNRRLAL